MPCRQNGGFLKKQLCALNGLEEAYRVAGGKKAIKLGKG
jgi:hypothetical protein